MFIYLSNKDFSLKLNEFQWLGAGASLISIDISNICPQNAINIGVKMGNCQYCGKPAGLLHKKHIECENQYIEKQKALENGRQEITALVATSITGTDSFDNIETKIAEIENHALLSYVERNSLIIKGWETAVDRFLDDGILNEIEEKKLMDFSSRFNLSQNDLDKNGAFLKTVKAAVLRDIVNGIIPQHLQIKGNFSINFQKGEQVIWAFPNTKYLEDKTKRHYVGGSVGLSTRIMKGVYLRTSAFKGQPIDTTVRVHIDTGWTIITDKNLYFAGPAKAVRIPYNKVLSFEPFSDGVGVLKDTTTAKLQIFTTGDGWFTYNLLTNLAKM